MLFLLRLGGEVATKSRRVRARFQQRLVNNIHQALNHSGIEHRVRYEWSRLFVEAQDINALAILTRIFGIRSLSEIEHSCEPVLQTIIQSGGEWYRDQIKGKTFAVRARRSGEHDFSSQDVNEQLGAVLVPFGKVNLGNPDITVHVEVRPDKAYFFSTHQRGAGGLPVGVEGNATCLISGGFDSAVAAWGMLKRGVCLDYVLCNLAGPANERSVLRIVKILSDAWGQGSRPRLHVVEFSEVVSALRKNVQHKYIQVVLKRLMYRVGAQIARVSKSQALVTGEAIGQVSSQTLTNLRAIDEVAPIPVLRPLIAMDKEDIIDQSRQIGTYSISASVQEYCALVPERPVTAARVDRVLKEESKIDLTLLSQAVDKRRILSVHRMDPSEMVVSYIYTEEVPQDAVVIDCRSRHHFERWHYPDAIHFELDELMQQFQTLKRTEKYVLYCPFGLQSSVVAERMQKAGYEAYSFKGGTQTLLEYTKQHGIDPEDVFMEDA